MDYGGKDAAANYATVQEINDMGLSWTAATYDDNCVRDPTAMQLAQTKTHKRGLKKFGADTDDFKNTLLEAQKYLRHPESIDMADLPTDFRWDNLNGYDFTSHIVDQKACGSCYAIATNSMLESRLKIWEGVDLKLSTQFTIQCNPMTEGCHGGWGHLTGFFLEDYYTVSESCAPYSASTKIDGCKEF